MACRKLANRAKVQAKRDSLLDVSMLALPCYTVNLSSANMCGTCATVIYPHELFPFLDFTNAPNVQMSAFVSSHVSQQCCLGGAAPRACSA